MLTKVVGAVGGLIALVPVFFGAAGGTALDTRATGAPVGDSFSSDVPPAPWALYEEAAAAFGLQAGLLAAVGKVECDHGRDPDCATPNEVGALGPMQFRPRTWDAHRFASGSSAPSPLDPRDAVFAAAHKLAVDGAGLDPSGALHAYNPSAEYVATVEAWALAYGWSPPDPTVLAEALLNHPNTLLRDAAATDVRAGLVDERVLAVLLIVATRHELAAVGPFVTGHSLYVRGTDRVSNHARGRAVDVPLVDDRPVSGANDGARAVVALLASLPTALRPDEIGCPWPELAALPGVFSDPAHDDHLHLGFEA